jgi:tetratricopeptide (TPR) repeat protein
MFGKGAFRLAVLAAAFVFASAVAGAQDLGSSNKLFGGGKKTTQPKPAKKPAAKPKTAAVKKKAPAKPTASAARPDRSRSKAKPPEKTAKQSPDKAKPEKNAKQAAVKSNPKNAAQEADEPARNDWDWRDEIKPIDKERFAPRVSPANLELFEDLIDEGNQARDERNYAAAEAAYRRAATLKPKDSRAVYGLGNVHSDQQRWTEAEAAYREALQIEPGFAITHIALSYVLTQPIPVENLADRYEEAERLARKAIQIAPSNALAHDQLGVAMELRGLISAETENAYRRAIQLDPDFAPAYAHLGRLLRRQGRTQESAAAYKTAVELADDVPTAVLVAEVMQSEQRYADSEKLLISAIQDDPRNAAALLLLGRAQLAQNKFDEAERTLRTSISVSPNAYVANTLLASLYLRQGDLDMAENSLLQALRFVPSIEKRLLARQFESLGDAFLKSASSRYAERNYRQAQTLDPENAGIGAKLTRTKRG